jgi:hypothetical protein
MFFIAVSIPVWMVAEWYIGEDALDELRQSLSSNGSVSDCVSGSGEEEGVRVDNVSLMGGIAVTSHE